MLAGNEATLGRGEDGGMEGRTGRGILPPYYSSSPPLLCWSIAGARTDVRSRKALMQWTWLTSAAKALIQQQATGLLYVPISLRPHLHIGCLPASQPPTMFMNMESLKMTVNTREQHVALWRQEASNCMWYIWDCCYHHGILYGILYAYVRAMNTTSISTTLCWILQTCIENRF